MYEEIYAQAKQACNELCDVAKLKEGSIVVIGCSSSEVAGGTIGHNSSLETAQAVSRVYTKCFAKEKFTLPHNAVNISIVQSSLSERLFRTLKS